MIVDRKKKGRGREIGSQIKEKKMKGGKGMVIGKEKREKASDEVINTKDKKGNRGRNDTEREKKG